MGGSLGSNVSAINNGVAIYRLCSGGGDREGGVGETARGKQRCLVGTLGGSPLNVETVSAIGRSSTGR